MAEHDDTRRLTTPRCISGFTERTLGDEEAAISTNENHDNNLLSPAAVMSEKQPRSPLYYLNIDAPDPEELYRFWRRFTRKGKKKVGVMKSLRTFALSSCMFLFNSLSKGQFNQFVGLNLFLIFTPLAWLSHWASRDDWSHGKWPPQVTFVRTSQCVQ
jgi:Ca2+:H+ antiporter